MRDHVMGIRAVTGTGEVFRSGGRVLKNVTGLDLAKLLTGSHGTLGVLTEITLKVLPAPERTATVTVRVPDLAAGVRALSAGLGTPYGVSGAALLPDGGRGGEGPLALLRIEDFAESVTYRAGRLRDELAGAGEASLVEDAESRDLWRRVRDAEPLGAEPGDAVWRVSVRPTAGPAAARAVRAAAGLAPAARLGRRLVWIAGPPTAEAPRRRGRRRARRGRRLHPVPRPGLAARGGAVLPEEPAPLAATDAG
jgi:glycolate oxidase FAD binding subunit